MLILGLLLVACVSTTPDLISDVDTPAETVSLAVVYTSDEHGWMAGEAEGGDAAELAGLWTAAYQDYDAVLILSGGDNWTGPAISTWFQGESMVEARNAMGYTASVVGNHEFDFGLDVMHTRFDQDEYPYLRANIRYKDSNSFPDDLGVQPYTIVSVSGLKIGLIGLANVDTPSTANPKIVSGFDFAGYTDSLREYVPAVRAEGVDLVFVPTHLCTRELAPLVRDVSDLGITLFGGGHCHEEFAGIIDGSVILSGGSNLRSYAYATFEINLPNVEIIDADYGVRDNTGGTPHPQVAEIISH